MPPLRTHRIADGDTLGRIATTYLGEAARQEAILELNREVLGDNPDLLPIGAVLKIPAAVPAKNRRPGSADGPSELVPIPPGALHH
jgi:phage tail protein X